MKEEIIKNYEEARGIVGAGVTQRNDGEILSLTIEQKNIQYWLKDFYDYLSSLPEQPELNLRELDIDDFRHKYWPCETYYPNGDFKKEKIHDKDCPSCEYSRNVEEIAEAFAADSLAHHQKQWEAREKELTESLKEAIEKVWMFTQGGHVSSYLRQSLEKLHKVAKLDWPKNEPKFKDPT